MDEPKLTREGEAFVYTWPNLGLGIGFDLLRESRSGLQGEISIETTQVMPSGSNGHISWGLFNLSAIETRMKMAEKLTEFTHADTRDEWLARLEYACYTTATLFRRGATTQQLRTVVERKVVSYLIEHFLPVGHTTIVYGKGGAGKGWLATAMGLACCLGQSFAAIKPTRQVGCLYLDWEATDEEARRRLGWLARGLRLSDIPVNFYYREMARPVVDELRAIKAEIARLDIGLVIVDSLVPACGDDPYLADSARQVMGALRSLAPATRLVIAHLTKQAAREASGEASVFGSGFFEYLGRSVWELRCTDATEQAMDLALFHRKVNVGAKLPPQGWRLNWNDQEWAATLRPIDVGDAPDLARHASLAWRIRAALRQGAMEAPELAEQLGVSQDVLRATCGRMSDVVNASQAKGPGQHARWGLAVGQTRSVTQG